MGMFLFILGVMMIVGGLGFGLPLMWRGDLATGGALGIILPTSVLGLGACIAGLMMGKSKRAPAAPAPLPAPVAAPPPPQESGGLTCPTCNRKLPPGVNRCPFCHPLQPAAPPPPPPPPPMAPAIPQPIAAGNAARGRGAVAGPNGYLQILSGPATGRQFTIAPGIQITIGRGDENVLVIPDAEISTRHCVLTCANDRIMFQDLGSSNGSFLNGQPYQQGYINSGDQLQLGRQTTLFFSYK